MEQRLDQADDKHIYQPHEAEASEKVNLDDGGETKLLKKVTIPASFWQQAQVTREEDARPILQREADALCLQQGYILESVEKVAQEADGAWSIYVVARKSRLAFGSRDPLDGRPVAGIKDMLGMLNRHGRRAMGSRNRSRS